VLSEKVTSICDVRNDRLDVSTLFRTKNLVGF
jgi:hypothetical protein